MGAKNTKSISLVSIILAGLMVSPFVQAARTHNQAPDAEQAASQPTTTWAQDMMKIIMGGLTPTSLLAEAAGASARIAKGATHSPTPGDKKATEASVKGDVASDAGEKIDEKRKRVIKEAVTALAETRKALKALEEKKTGDALTSLEKATGKLELILARDPDLALAATDVSVSTFDLLTTLEAIHEAKDRAGQALEDGKVQLARKLLRNLVSEIVISVTSIPLATYPEAIKTVAPLIDAGKIAEAKAALNAALSTLVVTRHVIPLPFLRAEAMLGRAESLAEKESRAEGENQRLSSLLDNARYQLEMAQALGYGKKRDYEQFYQQLDQIEEKTSGGKSGEGFFDTLKAAILEMRKVIYK